MKNGYSPTIEYWDLERKRYPQYEHTAVIVAEDITSRFLNVIQLFNGAIPLIALKMTAYDCLVLGVVDAIVPEPENGAHVDPDYAALLLRGEIVSSLTELRKRDPRRLVEERWRKFRRMGEFQKLVEAAEGHMIARCRTALLEPAHHAPHRPRR